MKRTSFFVGLILVAALGTFAFTAASAAQKGAQTSAGISSRETLEFEVATIKPYELDRLASVRFSGGSCHGIDKEYKASPIAPPPLGRCVFRAVNLTSLLGIAHNVSVSGGPAWASSDYFDLEGKAEDTATVTEAQLISMLQTLLMHQFHVEFHREQRQVEGFTLYVGKNGPKLKESTAANDAPPRVQFGGAKCTAEHVTMAYFANSIRGMAHGPVTDKTGLSGAYDFTFEWEPGDPNAFLSEMQFALGLRVEAIKLPMDFLIIDRAEKPAGD